MQIFNEIIYNQDRLEKTFEGVIKGKKELITYFNKHCFNIYQKNSDYRKSLQKFYIYADGIGIYYALKYLGKKPDRLNATDINFKIFEKFIKRKTLLYLIGGNFIEAKICRMSEEKGLNLLGYNSGFFNRSDFDTIIDKILRINPESVIIGMGVPQQEFFAEKLSEKFSGSIICVGNFLEFYFGTVKRAPFFLRKIGLEWFFRLLVEPRRLFKRYFLGIPLFIYRIIKIKNTINN